MTFFSVSRQCWQMGYICAAVVMASVSMSTAMEGKPIAKTETDRAVFADPQSLGEAQLQTFQAELLELAFDAAMEMPINLHVKDRCRSQRSVAVAWLELDQPVRALQFIKRIDNWRRGLGYAELACYLAEHGRADDAQVFLDLAEGFAENPTIEDWRRHRIQVKLSEASAILGRSEDAAEYESEVGDSEEGKLAATEARLSGDDVFEEQLARIDELAAAESLDLAINGLHAYSQLYGRFYDSPDKRAAVLERIRSSWERIPVFLRLRVLTTLVDFALEHSDPAEGLELVLDMYEMFEQNTWPIRYEIPLGAQLATLRYRCGQEEEAEADLSGLIEEYDANRHLIGSFERAETLRPIAESYWEIGSQEESLAIYRRVIEEGAENPNARPRCQDLVASCVSMAVRGVQPDAAMWARIREIRDGLGHPW